MPTSCEGSLDFIPGIARPVESSFAHGNETIRQQAICPVKPRANLTQHDLFAL